MKRILLAGLILLLLVAAGIAWVIFDSKTFDPPSPITLPDGTVLEIKTVTVGTNHDTGSRWKTIIHKLPRRLQNLAYRVYPASANTRSFTSTQRELWVWLDTTNTVSNAPGTYQYYQSYLADENGFVSGDSDHLFFSQPNSETIVRFKAWPRRSRTLQLHLYERSSTTNSKTPLIVSFVNPDYLEKAPWTPEPLPATKTDGDLKVTLESFATGHGTGISSEYKDGKWTTIRNRRDGPENESMGVLRFEQASKTNAPWEVTSVRISDPGGNSIGQTSLGNSQDRGEFSFSPALWPNEPAWKLQLEVKRYTDFATNEVFTFKAVPIPALGQSNYLALSTNVGEVVITLTHIVHRPPLKKNSWTSYDLSEIGFTNSTLPKGFHLDMVSITANDKKVDSGGWRSSANERQFQFREFPTNATGFDITMVLHRSRTVEFLVKPEVAQSELILTEGFQGTNRVR